MNFFTWRFPLHEFFFCSPPPPITFLMVRPLKKKKHTPEHVTNLECLEPGDSPPTFLHHVEKMCCVGFFDHEHAERRFYGLGLLKVRWKVKVLWVSKSK